MAFATDQLQNGVLAASAAGRALMAATFFAAGDATSYAQYEDAFWAASTTPRAKFAAGFVNGTLLGADAVDGSKIADAAIDSEHYVAGSIDGAHLSADAKTTVLASKLLVGDIVGADRSSPGASSEVVTAVAEFGPFSTTAGVIGDGSVKGIPVLLEGAGVDTAHAFNTTSGKVGTSSAPGAYMLRIVDANGDEIPNSNGDPVWAVITASARTTGGTYTLRFFAGEWGSGNEAAYTLSVAYTPIYPKVFDGSDIPFDALRRGFAKISAVAAGIGTGQITSAMILDGTIVNDDIANDTITNAKISSAAAIAESKLADLGKEGASTLLANLQRRGEELGYDALPAQGAVVGVSTELKVTPKATPAQNVRVQTSGVVYGAAGERYTIAANADLTIAAADATNPRYDLIYAATDGTAKAATGTPAGSPSVPANPGDFVARLAILKVAANDNTHDADDLFDHRLRMGREPDQESFTGDGSTTARTLAANVSKAKAIIGFRNGAMMAYAASPSGKDQYSATKTVESQGTTVTTGTAHASTDTLHLLYFF